MIMDHDILNFLMFVRTCASHFLDAPATEHSVEKAQIFRKTDRQPGSKLGLLFQAI
jgi:hypothetical protein